MRLVPIAIAVGMVATLAGCKTLKNLDASSVDSVMQTASTAGKALSLTDGDVVALSNESCQAMDAENRVAPAKNKYTQRLSRVVKAFPKEINGKTANYKVYLTKDVNAWAMANGCIRVYSGLMDLMNDDELRGVIGHEIGHVALGHSKSAMQTAYATSAARQIAAQSGNAAVATLSRSAAGELAEKFLNAQFSQSQETASDNYSFDQLQAKKLNTRGLVTAFQKLAELDGGKSDMMSSHPSSTKRAQHIEDRIAKAK